jgi:hypothetical protein
MRLASQKSTGVLFEIARRSGRGWIAEIMRGCTKTGGLCDELLCAASSSPSNRPEYIEVIHRLESSMIRLTCCLSPRGRIVLGPLLLSTLS